MATPYIFDLLVTSYCGIER